MPTQPMLAAAAVAAAGAEAEGPAGAAVPGLAFATSETSARPQASARRSLARLCALST
jgi:hypothetical protein